MPRGKFSSMIIQHVRNSSAIRAALTVLTFPAPAMATTEGGAEPPHTRLCGPHATCDEMPGGDADQGRIIAGSNAGDPASLKEPPDVRLQIDHREGGSPPTPATASSNPRGHNFTGVQIRKFEREGLVNRRIVAAVGGALIAALVPIGAAAIDGAATVAVAAPEAGPICLDSAGFGGVYCIWPEETRRPVRNSPPASPQPPPVQNQPPASN